MRSYDYFPFKFNFTTLICRASQYKFLQLFSFWFNLTSLISLSRRYKISSHVCFILVTILVIEGVVDKTFDGFAGFIFHLTTLILKGD